MHRRNFLVDRGLACVWNLGDQHREDTQIEARQKQDMWQHAVFYEKDHLNGRPRLYTLDFRNDGLSYPLRLIILIII